MALPKVGVEAVIEGMAAFEADSKKVNKSLGKMDESIGLLSKTSISLGSNLTKLAGNILKLGAVASGAGILAIGAGLFKAAQAGLSMNDAMEQASAKINAFTKDGAKTAEILEMIRDRASRTPFEFQEMANAAAGLLPASRQAGVGLAEIIEQAEILAASNPAEGLEGAAFALREAVSGDFTSIIERFNLPRTMINQLKEEGLPNLEIVSRAMKELGFDTDLVSALAETAQGRWSTFKDTLTNVAATVTQPIFTAFSKSLGDVNMWLVANEPLLTSMANILANQVATALTTIGGLLAAFQSGGTEGLVTALGLGSLVTMWATIQPILNQIVTWFQTNLPTALNVAQTAFNTISAVVMSFANTVIANIWPQLQEAFANITQALNNMGLTWGDVFTALGTATKIVASVIGIAILAIIGTVTGLVTGFASAFATISGYFVDFQNAISQFVSGITTLFTGLITITSGLLIGDLGMIFKGVEQSITGLFETIRGLGNFLLTSMQASLGGLFSFVRGWMSSFLGFFDGLAPALGERFEDTWTSIREVWKPEKWFELGTSIIDGILEGIKKNQDKVIEMLKSMMADVIKGAKDVIGFGSPATEFMPIGESMVQGMLLGAKKEKFAKRFVDDLNMGGIARSLGTGGGQWRNFRNIIKQTIGLNFDQLMTSGMSAAQIIDKIQKVAARFNFPPSFASEFAMANGLIEHLTSSVTEFQKAMRLENMGRMVQIGGQFASIGQSLVDMLKPVDDGRIQTLQDFLSGKVEGRMFAHPLTGVLEEMVVLQQDGLEVALNRTLAQQELNRLLEEQRRQEELIAQQKKSQEQLSFLQQQIELIKMGKEVGGNIFQGIKFGLDASVTDLLNATNNVVNAMVDQINQDLQISSPSKVMARIGQQMMAGLQGGIASMTPVLNAQLSASVAGPLSPSMAGAMNSSSYNTTNNFNIGGNNISNGMNAAEFESRVLQVIRRNL